MIRLMMIAFAASFLAGAVFGQQTRIQIADGMLDEPTRFDLQPKVETLPKAEIEEVRKIALSGKFVSNDRRPQMSSEESVFVADFVLHDVAEGFFVSREFESRAYLYTAYSQTAKRNYHGIVVLSSLDNDTRFRTERHVVYEFRGDKYIRMISDLNGNFLSELAVFAFPPEKTRRIGWLRILEFNGAKINRIGAVRIHSTRPVSKDSSVDKPSSSPGNSSGEALIVYFNRRPSPGMQLEFEEWSSVGKGWVKSDKASCDRECLIPDATEYVSLP